MNARGAHDEAPPPGALAYKAFCPIGSWRTNVAADRSAYLETFLSLFRQELHPQPARPPADVDVELALIGAPAELREFAPPPGAPATWRAGRDGTSELRTGRFAVTRRDGHPLSIRIAVREPLYSAQAFRDRLAEVVAKLLFRSQRVVLHSGAVATDGRADLFVGDTHSGKTTVCLRLAAAGATVLSEDRVLLHRGGAGFTASGCRDVCRVTEETERHFFPRGGVAARLGTAAELRLCEGSKKEFSLAALFPTAPYREFPVRRLYFAHIGDALRIDALARPQAALRLLGRVQRELLPDTGERAALLEYCADLAAGCEAFDLTLSRGFADLDALTAAVLA